MSEITRPPKVGGKRSNPLHSIIPSGLTIQMHFNEKTILEVNGVKIHVYLMSLGSNQASVKYHCPREVQITRENILNPEEGSNADRYIKQ